MSEDQAFARAALAAGFSLVYDPEAGVYHGHRYSLGTLFRRNFDSGYSLRGIAGDGWGAVARMGLHYVGGELRYLAQRGKWALPFSLGAFWAVLFFALAQWVAGQPLAAFLFAPQWVGRIAPRACFAPQLAPPSSAAALRSARSPPF